MKIRLLNNGCYYRAFDSVALPVVVEAELNEFGSYDVPESELARIGCDMDLMHDHYDPVWPFSPSEVEVLS